ncbi:MAG: hypothetical protein A3J46_02180 [Candidatus Yanofskybacteria bacterium RIFCSPHIGHO2_02_FULL_41_11]|uniref:Uncharacterized protein n=1 Tax=Candidatus Yanofskybacteria bacterium RIFCSPHIGHO2_02_FULL_41_11 TaxID=1802675 RepID=A0A1F8FCW1_9BACT|nr:MAG: hypothetical protein A3J46_02180 [Candidatus Yanofskybacteria bacterium RIFCSPHIGHO2_02_FULL_41_11]
MALGITSPLLNYNIGRLAKIEARAKPGPSCTIVLRGRTGALNKDIGQTRLGEGSDRPDRRSVADNRNLCRARTDQVFGRRANKLE